MGEPERTMINREEAVVGQARQKSSKNYADDEGEEEEGDGKEGGRGGRWVSK